MKATFEYCYPNMAFWISKTVSDFELLHYQSYFLNCWTVWLTHFFWKFSALQLLITYSNMAGAIFDIGLLLNFIILTSHQVSLMDEKTFKLCRHTFNSFFILMETLKSIHLQKLTCAPILSQSRRAKFTASAILKPKLNPAW